MPEQYGHPIYRITHQGEDVTQNFSGRLMRLNLVDNRGLDADELDIELDDSDGKLVIPAHGDLITVAIGWNNSGLVNKGIFAVDETEHRGAPDVISVRGRSKDISTGLIKKRDWSWHDTTVGQIIQEIATEHDLKPVIDPVLGGRTLRHFDRTGESAVNILTRLGLEHDAVATIKAGNMLFMPIGKGVSISGMPLGHVSLKRSDGDNHRFLQADRQGETWTGVRAIYYDVPGAQRKEAIAGSDERPFELRHTYTDEQSALHAANSEWLRRQRQASTLSYTLALGRPALLPEMTFSLHGIKGPIDAVTWLCSRVIHRIEDGGYTTELELETKLESTE